MYYHARYYNPVLARFISADSIIPGQSDKSGAANPQELNRFSYVTNNPLKNTDPTGHVNCAGQTCEGAGGENEPIERMPGGAAGELGGVGGGVVSENVGYESGSIWAEAPKVIENIESGASKAYDAVIDAVTGSGEATPAGTIKPVEAGEAGSYGDLSGPGRAVKGDQLEAHHMPQKAAGYTDIDEGGALVMTRAEHMQTRTYGGRGIRALAEDSGLSFRQVLAKDIRDVRSIVGSAYNSGLKAVIQYYRDNFPSLIRR